MAIAGVHGNSPLNQGRHLNRRGIFKQKCSVAYTIRNRVVRVVRNRKGSGRMAKAEATVEEMVGMIERGELRLAKDHGVPIR